MCCNGSFFCIVFFCGFYFFIFRMLFYNVSFCIVFFFCIFLYCIIFVLCSIVLCFIVLWINFFFYFFLFIIYNFVFKKKGVKLFVFMTSRHPVLHINLPHLIFRTLNLYYQQCSSTSNFPGFPIVIFRPK